MIRRLVAVLALLAAFPAAAQQAPSGRLVLYTSQPQADAQATIDAFRRVHPNVEVTFTRDGTTQLMNRLQAEFVANAPQPDVLLIADAMTMESLKRENRLQSYPGARVDGLPQGSHDSDKTYFATKLITTGIVYNTKAPMKPASWLDLTKTEAKNLLAMPSPLNSGAAMIHTITLAGNLPTGWAFYEALKTNGALAAGSNGDILRQVATGEKLYGMIVDFMPIREKAKGAPVEFVFPSEGVSAVSEPVAILKTSKNPEAAKAFVDFLLSKDGQELALKQGYVAAHPDVALPAGYPARSAIKLMPFDAAKALADEAAARKRFSAIFE